MKEECSLCKDTLENTQLICWTCFCKMKDKVRQSKLKEVLKIIDKKINRLKSGNHKKDIFKYWKVTTKELEKLKSQLSGVRK